MMNISDKRKCNHCKKELDVDLFDKRANGRLNLVCINCVNKMKTKHKRCSEPDCNKRPYFNIEGEKTALYCATHKKTEMVNVKSKRCIEPDCNKQPIYNVEGDKTALYCSNHKKEGMIDVISKRCIEPDCNKHSIYNVEGVKTPLYCINHKKEGMINVKSKRCKNEWCSTLGNRKYENYCMPCYVNNPANKDKIPYMNLKTKESSVTDFIKEHFNQYTIISDKTISDGCSRRRPDILLDFGDQIIIIEVDENKHSSYDCSCENKRLMEISKDLNHRPVVFIRFNPDSYVDINGNKITSCWRLNKLGIMSIVQNKKSEWKFRLNALKEQINYWIQNKTNKMIEIIKLFY